MAGVNENETTYPMMMSEIAQLYGELFDEWIAAVTKPCGLRCPANPHPWTYFHGTPRLQVLYKDSTEHVAAHGDIGQMVDHLVKLFEVCKESGRGLYFSRTMLRLELTPDAKKKVALAFVVGMLEGHFHTDLFCEVEYVDGNFATGMVKIAAEKEAMKKVAEETGCPAVMLVIDARNEKTLHAWDTMPSLKRFAAEGLPVYRGVRSDYPHLVGLWRKPTVQELVLEIEYQMATDARMEAVRNGTASADAEFAIDLPLWRRPLNSLSPEEKEAAKLLH